MKRLVGLASRMFALGLALLLVGFAMAGFSLENLNTRGPYEQKTFESDADVNAVSVEDMNHAVTICPSPDGLLRVTYYEREDEHYEVGVDDNGVLTVRYVLDKKWYEHIELNFPTPDARVIVYLPERFVVPVSVQNTNGEIRAENLDAVSLSLKTVNGHISVDGVRADRIGANIGNGGVALHDVHADGAIEIAGVNGAIELARVEAGRIAAHSTNGRIVLDAVDAQDAEYRTTNGGIGGNLAGAASDYTITAKTVNGGNSLTSGGSGARRLHAETVNGGIDVSFAR